VLTLQRDAAWTPWGEGRRRRFWDGLWPVHSPLLRPSQLLSFPGLIDMLKFSPSFCTAQVNALKCGINLPGRCVATPDRAKVQFGEAPEETNRRKGLSFLGFRILLWRRDAVRTSTSGVSPVRRIRPTLYDGRQNRVRRGVNPSVCLFFRDDTELHTPSGLTRRHRVRSTTYDSQKFCNSSRISLFAAVFLNARANREQNGQRDSIQ
jgi:hypothetical protein